MKYVEALVASGFAVDRYGNCFDNRDEFNAMPAEQRDSYKFYLAFENSLHCRDYVTEKFWRNAIIRGSVPVVWGPSRQDMAELAPPGSYVHVEDFDSPAELGKYLKYLDESDAAYRKYFEWMVDYEAATAGRHYIQKFEHVEEHLLCEKLRRGGFKRKTIESLDGFWYGTENDECYIK